MFTPLTAVSTQDNSDRRGGNASRSSAVDDEAPAVVVASASVGREGDV